jgi:hypothetical protein
VARWIQRTIESILFPPMADPALPVIEASFERSGDPRGVATERVVSADEEVLLAWYDFNEPFVLTMPPGYANRPIGVFSTFFPARSAQVTLNGEVAMGSVWSEMRGDRQSSSACLAWSETWVKPKA